MEGGEEEVKVVCEVARDVVGGCEHGETWDGRERARVAGEVGEEVLLGEENCGIAGVGGPAGVDAEVACEEAVVGPFGGEVGFGEEAEAEGDRGGCVVCVV